RAAPHHGVEPYQEFSHDGREGKLHGLVGGKEAVVEGFQVRVETDSRHRCHVEHASDVGASAPNASLASALAAVVVEWGDTDERGDLLSVQRSKLGHVTNENPGSDRANTRHALKDVVTFPPEGTLFDGLVEVVLE